jgi:SAM-dependent methyltransferase
VFSIRDEHGRQQTAGDGEEFGDVGVGDPVEDVTRAPGRRDEPVAAQHGQVLRQMRRLEPAEPLQFGDAVFGAVGEQLEQPDPERMGEALKETGLDLVERSFIPSKRHDKFIISCRWLPKPRGFRNHPSRPRVPGMVQDSWLAGDRYEPYVGRWSRRVASQFVKFLIAPRGGDWLDVGCGTGALSEAVLDEGGADSVTGIDPSAAFVGFARERLDGRAASFDVGDAQELPYAPAYFDVVVSGLVLNFVPDSDLALREQHRVLKPGGVVGAYVWDYPRMTMMARFWDAATSVDSGDVPDEALRFSGWTDRGLAERFNAAGFGDIGTTYIEIPTVFEDFDDLWSPFLGGQGAAPSYLATLDDERRDAIRDIMRAGVPGDGPIELNARAWAVKATRP